MLLVLLKICDFGLTNRWKVSDFKFLDFLWSNVSVGYITTLPLVFKKLLFDSCLRLLMDDKRWCISRL